MPVFLDDYRKAALDAPHGQDRLKVLEEAWTWLYTPWRHESRVKGAGVDCGNLVSGVFAGAGLIELPPVLTYPHDFYLHSADELFVRELEKFCCRVEGDPLPADVVGFKIGMPTVGHIAIVIRWPVILHSVRPSKQVTLDDVITGPLQRAYVGVWRLKEWCE